MAGDATQEPRESEGDAAAEVERLTLPHASPAVRRMAGQFGVDLAHVQGSGAHGRVLEGDVKAWVAQEMSIWREPDTDEEATRESVPEAPAGSTRVELSRIRRRTAEDLQRSWREVPQVTLHDRADVTRLEVFRAEQVPEALARGFELSLLAFVVLVSARALRAFPDFNASLAPDGAAVLRHGSVNIGVAVDTPEGLIVPVIRDADRKGLMQIAEELAELSGRMSQGDATMQDLSAGTFTVAGLGGTGFTPRVKVPEVAILGVSRMSWEQVWTGDGFEARRMLPLSLSYDHRVIDGAAAARFTAWLARALADVRRLLL